ncbi:gluconate transporter [Bifidobacterium actinocoloniiforme DSM 22766]|uniref:Gluconate transporter n=1 Tax=Bifidobacterium actinocoloniiforme DSM 22766 TaxID=1437605 RepID=A0A086Z2J3_9BIFI|nr:gluconate:H+ symporter [Bifidobacterium actinocoloniiforme]AKV55728.1 permease DsdX [Bifidobacterium actinocoloniiforme DSM 22766]KFI40743.1 gluconate transporter [Bifidobacterium actinocoloniiforme DSM 22766]
MGTGPLLVVLLIAIAVIVLLIVKVKMHPSLALLLAAFLVAFVTRVPLGKISDILEKGVGDTLGFLTLIIGFGAVLGKLLEVSGGAQRLAHSMLKAFGKQRATIIMALLGLICGIPVFVEVGFVLLVPLVFVVAKEAGISRLKVGIPLATSLMVVHCILPPHPAATAIAGTLHADIGMVILLGLCVAIPSVLVGGVLFAHFAIPAHDSSLQEITEGGLGNFVEKDEKDLPGFGITLLTILLPLLIMVTRTICERLIPADTLAMQWINVIGNPISALTIALLFAYFSLGLNRGFGIEKLQEITDGSFGPIGGILLIIGAGGAFNAVLTASGVAPGLAKAFAHLPVSPVILAWLIALILHFAVGSATVAMISAAGIVLPMLSANPNLSPAILALAIGAGAIGLTHVTDSLFWMVKEYLQISVPQAYKTLTVGTTITSVVALCMTLLLSLVV